MNLLAIAISFAAEKHIGQVDKGGAPYILHPLRVMSKLNTNDQELMAIAVLHDLIEDCGVSPVQLRNLGMTYRVIAGVEHLTKKPGWTYEQFIERVLENPDATLVKIADLKDNMDVSRLKTITTKDVERLNKYAAALALLVTPE